MLTMPLVMAAILGQGTDRARLDSIATNVREFGDASRQGLVVGTDIDEAAFKITFKIDARKWAWRSPLEREQFTKVAKNPGPGRKPIVVLSDDQGRPLVPDLAPSTQAMEDVAILGNKLISDRAALLSADICWHRFNKANDARRVATAERPDLVRAEMAEDEAEIVWATAKLRAAKKAAAACPADPVGLARCFAPTTQPEWCENDETLRAVEQALVQIRGERPSTSAVAAPATVQGPSATDFGTVRFIVRPWATVQCGTLKLGDTPMADKRLPVGTHECTFTNPKFPERKQAVIVMANETVRVAVNFLSN